MAAESLFASQYIHGIYIPAGLLVFGMVIVKMEWTPYAALLAVVLGALKFYNLRELTRAAFQLSQRLRVSDKLGGVQSRRRS